ncbi:hypothetical protein B0H19DRAFT_1076542 [Mycena capillaripes]|nr:hypothetical protein B0H19DRAFT_1076542 [Mycena capillaripes]
MANFTTTLLGSFSRIFFPPSVSNSGLTHSRSGPDVAAEHTHLRPTSSASVRPRPSSAIEGYWSWEGQSSGMILRRRTDRQDLELKGLADVKITHPSPVLACQPRRRTPSPMADFPSTPAASGPEELEVDTVADVNNALEYLDTTAPDSSFDISLISDTSITTSEDQDAGDSESDSSFTLPPPPIGLGICGLFKSDGSPFDGMGVVSFGCDAAGQRKAPRTSRRDAGGLSRVFLEEAAWTWAADPDHHMLTVIDEMEEELEEAPHVWVCVEQEGAIGKQGASTNHESKTSSARTRLRIRDLSTVDTISSGLKRQNPRTKALATVPAPRSPSVVPGARRAVSHPVWRV